MIWFYMEKKWNRFRQSISAKLFFMMLVLILVTTAVMYLFFYYSITSGLIQYVQKVDRQRLEIFSQALEINYTKHKNWDFVTKTSTSWENYLKDIQHSLSQKLVLNDIYMPGISEYRVQGVLKENIISINPSKLAKKIDQRVALFDTNRMQIAGHIDVADDIEFRPLTYQSEIVGYLGLTPVHKLSGVQQLTFQQKLLTIVLKMALILVVIMGIFVLLLSKRAVSRVLQLKDSVRLLTQGKYDTRMKVSAQDELGYLMKDVNVLAVSLQQHEKLRKQLFSDISHDLRTPITVLQTDIESIQDGIRACNMENLNSLQSQIVTMGKLVADIHELSMSDAGALNYEMYDIHINEPLKTVVDRFERLASDKGLTIHFQAAATDRILISGDQSRLEQLFTNIMSNAVKYTDAGGRIDVTTQVSTTEVRIVIADSAPSVPKEALPKLFDRSFRVESSRNRATGGSGIGLAIAKNIVEAHQGQIGADLSEFGGICMEIRLPRL